MKIAVDFDGVLCERYGIPTRGNFYDSPPTEDAVEAIKLLKKLGYELYIFTNRDPKEYPLMKKWLKEQGFPSLRITNIKEIGTSTYIDDRAIRFTNWQDIRKYFG